MNPHRLHPSLSFPMFLLAAVLFTGCAPKGPADEGVGNPRVLPVNCFETHWAEQLETVHGKVKRIFARDTYVIGYTDDGTSYVLDRATGAMPFPPVTIRNGDQALRAPVVLKDFIVYPTNTSLEVYDRAGALVRSKDLRYSIRSDAVGNKTFVYFGADLQGGGRVVAVDVTSEYLDHRWELMFPHAAISAAPAVWGDIVYAAATNGDVAAVSYDSREPLWPLPNGVFHTGEEVIADLQIDDTGVYVSSMDTKLCALNRNNGKVKWQYLAKAPLHDSPVVLKELVMQRVDGVGFVAIDKLAGAYNRAPRWIAPDVTKILSADAKFVYVLRNDNMIVALDKMDGHAVFTSTRHDLVTYTTNTKDATIFAVTTGNRVLAITPVLKPGVVGELAWVPAAPMKQVVALAR
ncbi:MAG TPA: PQQ-binding-like beta-propeller repeat protein [Tepidisphaeraceae bacterium]|nr:PQQ-binding-like beta-propeller repeat protein [Tepidisphaeraceae bacterium]